MKKIFFAQEICAHTPKLLKSVSSLCIKKRVRMGEIMIREITDKDYNGLMALYMQLHDNPMPEEIAIKENCYKLMLLTGSKQESTLNFYRKAGYNSEDKTAFIQWI